MEEWRDIPGWSGYRVSDEGRIIGPKGRILKGQPAGSRREYRAISRWVGSGPNKRRTTLTFHRAVALAFLGPAPNGCEVAHRDGDPSNNRVENLKWATHTENEADKIAHGTRRRGGDSVSALLTNEQAAEIRRRRAHGERGIDLAREFGVSPHIVSLIHTGRTYRDA